MTYKLIVRRLAEDDIAQAAPWYKQRRADLETEFIAEIESALQRAAMMPFAFQCIRRNPDVRRILTN